MCPHCGAQHRYLRYIRHNDNFYISIHSNTSYYVVEGIMSSFVIMIRQHYSYIILIKTIGLKF